MRKRGPAELQRRPRFIYTITYSNVALQVAALSLALYSLGSEQFDRPGERLLAAVLAVFGLFLVFLPTWASIRSIYREYNELEDKRGQAEAASEGANG